MNSGSHEKRAPAGPLHGVLALFLLPALAAALLWVAYCSSVRGSESSVQRLSPPSYSVQRFLTEQKAEALDELIAVKKIYRLEENATVAPAPDPEGYGTAANYEEFLPVLERAAGLLEGEELMLNGETPLLPSFGIRYYYDDSILVCIWQERIEYATCTFAEVRLGHASQLIRKLGGDSYGSPIQKYPSQLAREANAVLALNGDFYRFQNTGIHVYQGTVYTWDGSKVDTCFVDSEGDFHFVKAGELTEKEAVEQYVADNDILFSLSFGPVMVEDGENVVPPYYWMGQSRDYYARSCIAQEGPLHYLMMTVYMATTVRDAADWMIARGCTRVYAVDGGQSATIVLDGVQVNPSQFNAERTLSDIIAFGSAIARN